jgi:hypothetical protein
MEKAGNQWFACLSNVYGQEIMPELFRGMMQ